MVASDEDEYKARPAGDTAEEEAPEEESSKAWLSLLPQQISGGSAPVPSEGAQPYRARGSYGADPYQRRQYQRQDSYRSRY